MPHELWGTFSVRDHLEPRAFIADLMLYDKLVIPVPPDDRERERWRANLWDPERQDQILQPLKDAGLVRPEPWDDERQREWSHRVSQMSPAARSAPGSKYQATGAVLAGRLPAHAAGALAVASYPSLERLEEDFIVDDAADRLPGSTVAAVIGREFLVPNDTSGSVSDDELLSEAIRLATDDGFRDARSRFNDWWPRFVRAGVTDAESMNAALAEMKTLLDKERSALRRSRWLTGTQYAFALAAGGAALIPVPLVAAGVSTLLSLGALAVEPLLGGDTPGQSAAAMFHSAERHFGWKR